MKVITELKCRDGEIPEPLSETEIEGIRRSLPYHYSVSLIPRLVATIDLMNEGDKK